jgi:hypothetical protein
LISNCSEASEKSAAGAGAEWAQQLTGTWRSPLAQRLWLRPSDQLEASLVRWACPELPCKRMALARANA